MTRLTEDRPTPPLPSQALPKAFKDPVFGGSAASGKLIKKKLPPQPRLDDVDASSVPSTVVSIVPSVLPPHVAALARPSPMGGNIASRNFYQTRVVQHRHDPKAEGAVVMK